MAEKTEEGKAGKGWERAPTGPPAYPPRAAAPPPRQTAVSAAPKHRRKAGGF